MESEVHIPVPSPLSSSKLFFILTKIYVWALWKGKGTTESLVPCLQVVFELFYAGSLC